MRLIVDFHIHSKYSKATSKYSDLNGLSKWAKIKGINLLGTGDFTHPAWFNLLKNNLNECCEGIYEYNNQKFILTVEVNNIFERNNKTHKIHTIIISPSLEVSEQINDVLSKYGNLNENGRPTLFLSPDQMVEEIIELNKEVQFIPAHVWTPWFSLYGSKFGVNSIKEAFLDKARNVVAIETGLSSDPMMNWMVSETDNYTIISNSDAHSPKNLGREVNIFELKEISFKSIINILETRKGFIKTYEFYPQEGKYFWDGHRLCNISMPPEESEKFNNICPVCKKNLTLGVMHRIMTLADRPYGFKPNNAIPFQRIIPLQQIINKVLKISSSSKKVEDEYFRIIRYFGSEFDVFNNPLDKLILATSKEIALAIHKVSKGEVYWKPGFDGVYGDFSLSEIVYNNKQKRLDNF